MECLVATILRAMGYKARVTPKGPDRGVDVIASPDGLGLEEPRIKAEVKHRPKTAMGSQEIRSFLGGLRQGDRALYVSTGGFSKDAAYEADRSNIPITLVALDDLASLIVDSLRKLRYGWQGTGAVNSIILACRVISWIVIKSSASPFPNQRGGGWFWRELRLEYCGRHTECACYIPHAMLTATITMPLRSAKSITACLIEEDRAAGLDRQHAAAGGVDRFQRAEADRRHVEPHVLLRLGHFDDGKPAGAAERAGAADALVGALDRLDRQHGLVLHGHALADVEPAHLLGHPPAELDVFLLPGRRAAAGQLSFLHEQLRCVIGRRGEIECPRRRTPRRSPSAANRRGSPSFASKNAARTCGWSAGRAGAAATPNAGTAAP